MALNRIERRRRIHYRIRKHVNGTAERPRLAVYRSNANISAQIIDDVKGVTLVAASTYGAGFEGNGGNKAAAREVGKMIAEKAIAERALAAGINQVAFDRGGYLFHGRVKSLADAAREGGLVF